MALPGEATDDRGALEAAAGTAGTSGEPDVFAEVFDQVSAREDNADLHQAAEGIEGAEGTAAAVASQESAAGSAGVQAKQGEDDPTKQQPGETIEQYKQRYSTLQGIHRKDKETWEHEKQELLAQIEAGRKVSEGSAGTSSTAVERSAAAQAFVDSLTPEQQEQLKVYDEEFDTVSKMEGIKREVALGKLRKEIDGWKQEVMDQLKAQGAQLAPVVKMAEESEQEAHFNLIREGYVATDGTVIPGHSDFETYRDNGAVLAWIGTYPDYLQAGLKRAYEKGTAEQVIDLFNRFKRENNIPLPQPASENVISMNQRKAARKQALTQVPTRRGAVQTGRVVADDYDGSWDEAAIKSGG